MSDNQHYVTKAYLDRFVHPNLASERNLVLYPYAKGGRPCRPRGTKRLGCAEGFYKQRLVGGAIDNQLDEQLKEVESKMFASGKRNTGVLARCIFEDKLPTTPVDRVDLLAGLALMRCRTPVQIHNTSAQIDLANNMWFFNQLNSEKYREVYRATGIPEDEIDAAINKDRQEVLDGKLRMGVDDQRQQGLESFKLMDHMMPALLRMRIRLIKACHSDVFVTSDNPVVIHVPEDPRGQGLVQSKATEVWFPISYNRGLLLDHRQGADSIEQAGHSQTISLNRRILKWAYRFIYSPLRLEWLEQAANDESFNPLLGKMRSMGDFINSAKDDIVATVTYLNTAEPFDVFSGVELR